MSAGTITMPPPTPKSPAAKPPRSPITTRISQKGIGLVQNFGSTTNPCRAYSSSQGSQQQLCGFSGGTSSQKVSANDEDVQLSFPNKPRLMSVMSSLASRTINSGRDWPIFSCSLTSSPIYPSRFSTSNRGRRVPKERNRYPRAACKASCRPPCPGPIRRLRRHDRMIRQETQ